MKATSKNLAASRLCKKLSALRATLPNNERKILDELVTVAETSPKEPAPTTTRQAAKITRQPIRFDPNREEYQLIEL